MAQAEHRGRFATGCSICRQRKIKCDETRPSCNRCLKAGWKCPGYRELTDITFRNQYLVLTGNSRNRPAKKVGESGVGSFTFQACPAPSRRLVTRPLGQPRTLALDLKSVALAYFLSCHVISDSDTLVRGQYEFLSDLLIGQEHVDPALHHSLNSAAFAAFGNLHNSIRMIHDSRVECGLAIQAVNTALQFPGTAAKDTTLVAAMLLSTFETVTYMYQPNGKGCIDQLTGGLALLRIRGPKQLDTRFGLQIFLQAYFLVVSACIHTEHALPPLLSTLRTYVQPHIDSGNEFPWRVLDLMGRFADLRDTVEDHPDHQTADRRRHLFSIATKLDSDFQVTASCVPPNWWYRVFQCSDHVLAYNGIYHIYHDAWVIRYWNYVRLCRIFLQKTILDNHSPPLEPSSLQHQMFSANITRLSIDICATVPQHAGYIQLMQLQQIGSSQNLFDCQNSFSEHREVGAFTAGIYSLLFPLFAVGRTKFAPIRQRQWIIGRLEYLGRISGILQAFAAAEAMKSDFSQ